MNWAWDHPFTFAAGASAVSVGLGLAYARIYPDSSQALTAKITGRPLAPIRRAARVRNGIRREAVIVLGADTPLGRAVLTSLASEGLIVIAAVSSATSLKSFDTQLLPSSRGYVAVKHFDLSSLPDSIDDFVAEVKSTLALRFPLNAPGDPFARPGDGVILIGIINALSYVAAADSVATSPGMSNMATSAASAGASLQHALSIHVSAPVSAISALLPELRLGAQGIYAPSPDHLTPLTVLTLVDGGTRAHSESGTVAHLVAESATSAASTLRESATVHKSTNAQASVGTLPTRTLRFTVLSLPSASAKTTWTSKDTLTARVTNTVCDLVLASNTQRPLRPITDVYLPGPDVRALFIPVLQSLRKAHQKLLSSLPGPVAQGLLALYRRTDHVFNQLRQSLSNAFLRSRRRRLRDAREGAHRTPDNSALVKHIHPQDRVQGYDVDPFVPDSSTHLPRSSASAELDMPSSLETGSSAGDEVLRSAPSSSYDEEEDRAAPSSYPATGTASEVPSSSAKSDPVSTSQVVNPSVSSVHHPSSSQGVPLDASYADEKSSAGSSARNLDQSWVRLGESALHESQKQD